MQDDSGVTRGEHTRRRLLDAAVRRFAEAGYQHASLAVIARDAGVSPPAVYSHFADKQALFLAAFDDDAGRLLDSAMPDGAAEASLPPWLGLLPRLIARLPDHPLAHRVLAGREPELTGRLIDLPSAERVRATVEQSLRSAQRAGLARPDIDPALLAIGIQTVLLAVLLAAVQAGMATDERRRDGVLALLVAALRAPDAVDRGAGTHHTLTQPTGRPPQPGRPPEDADRASS